MIRYLKTFNYTWTLLWTISCASVAGWGCRRDNGWRVRWYLSGGVHTGDYSRISATVAKFGDKLSPKSATIVSSVALFS